VEEEAEEAVQEEHEETWRPPEERVTAPRSRTEVAQLGITRENAALPYL